MTMEEPLLTDHPIGRNESTFASHGGGNEEESPSSPSSPSAPPPRPLLHRFITDSRTEWSIRYTALHAIFYVLFFYPPKTKVYIDWSLPVQLISGGNLAFYSAGWSAWFGLGCAFSMVLAGCILSAIFPFLRDDDLGAAYATLMAIFLILSVPMISYIGVLNNLRSIGFVLIIVFTEVFYGPLLNFRHALPSTKSIFVEFVGPNALPSLIFVGICWAVYAVPPWHSATYQMLSLSSEVVRGISDSLDSAASILSAKATGESRPVEGGEKEGQRHMLRSMANSLLQQTNYAGLYTPISLYGDMGTYETSIFHPCSSLPADSFHKLGKYVDQTVYHVAIVLWAIGEIVDEVDDEELLVAAAMQLEAAGRLASAVSMVLECPRKSYRMQPIADRWESLKESIVTDPKWFDVPSTKICHAHSKTKQLAREATANAERMTKEYRRTTNSSANHFHTLLLSSIVSDLVEGQRHLVHFEHDRSLLKEEGSLGRLMGVAEALQESWSDSCAWPRLVSRLTFLEAISNLTLCWFRGLSALLCCETGVYGRRQFGRAVQYALGTMGLFAMATWWQEYSTLLGSSSTGQWSMVSFFVCFRSTADETIYSGIMRSIGHALGGLLSWGINTAVVSNGGRIGCHSALTLVFTWLIPTPFCVQPSKFQFPFDILSLTLLEGAMTTYHLTSVLVLSTSIESAAKARIASQCIGAVAAAVVSLVFPWFAVPQAERTLAMFRKDVNASLQNLGSKEATKGAATMVEHLLQTRRDVASAEEAKGWIPTADNNFLLDERLTNAVFGYVALEAILAQFVDFDGIPREVTACIEAGNWDGALGAIRAAIDSCDNDPHSDMARLYIEVLLLRESLQLVPDEY